MTSAKEREQLTATRTSVDCDQMTLNWCDVTAAYVSSPPITEAPLRSGETDGRTQNDCNERGTREDLRPSSRGRGGAALQSIGVTDVISALLILSLFPSSISLFL
ncbi:hypothetical protein M9458_054400 [Cirrhinus mrigala]|uniref:Uncharacterized protein n=1 Tax=Cirrhinus mrigala TaxID=683832 RepID=A0ABD0MMI7_CIRMR